MTNITTKTETEALFQDLDKPSLHALSYALRHPDVWPTGFVWNYNHCSHCAMGLAHLLWKKTVGDPVFSNGASVMARAFGMPYEEARDIFLEGRGAPRHFPLIGPRDFDRQTPERVADQIDKYLQRAE